MYRSPKKTYWNISWEDLFCAVWFFYIHIRSLYLYSKVLNNISPIEICILWGIRYSSHKLVILRILNSLWNLRSLLYTRRPCSSLGNPTIPSSESGFVGNSSCSRNFFAVNGMEILSLSIRLGLFEHSNTHCVHQIRFGIYSKRGRVLHFSPSSRRGSQSIQAARILDVSRDDKEEIRWDNRTGFWWNARDNMNYSGFKLIIASTISWYSFFILH